MSSIACMEVRRELLAETSTDVLTFCEYIKKLCGEIIALNEMLNRSPLDAFVLLAQILCISKLANVTDEHGRRYVFANHKNARFVYNDKRGKEYIKNIMHVLENMKTVLIGLYQTRWTTETHCNSVRSLLWELKLT